MVLFLLPLCYFTVPRYGDHRSILGHPTVIKDLTRNYTYLYVLLLLQMKHFLILI